DRLGPPVAGLAEDVRDVDAFVPAEPGADVALGGCGVARLCVRAGDEDTPEGPRLALLRLALLGRDVGGAHERAARRACTDLASAAHCLRTARLRPCTAVIASSSCSVVGRTGTPSRPTTRSHQMRRVSRKRLTTRTPQPSTAAPTTGSWPAPRPPAHRPA